MEMFVVEAALMAVKCVSLDGGRAAGSGETTQMCRSNTPQRRNYMGVTGGKKTLCANRNYTPDGGLSLRAAQRALPHRHTTLPSVIT